MQRGFLPEPGMQCINGAVAFLCIRTTVVTHQLTQTYRIHLLLAVFSYHILFTSGSGSQSCSSQNKYLQLFAGPHWTLTCNVGIHPVVINSHFHGHSSHIRPFLLHGLQVPISSVCWGYLLLLCWHDLCCGGDLGTLQQNNAAFFHPASTQLPLLIASTLPHHSLSPSPATEVKYQVTYSGATGCVCCL